MHLYISYEFHILVPHFVYFFNKLFKFYFCFFIIFLHFPKVGRGDCQSGREYGAAHKIL